MGTVIISSTGTSGPPGPGWLAGTGTPSSTIGIDGSFWLDQTNPNNPAWWGPKTLGAWTGHGPYAFTGNAATAITTTPYQLTAADTLILVDASAGSVVVNLGSAASTPNTPVFMKIDATGNTVTLTPASGEHINSAGAWGATTLVLATQGTKARLAPARVSGTWGWYQT